MGMISVMIARRHSYLPGSSLSALQELQEAEVIPLPQAQGSSGSADSAQSNQLPQSSWPEGDTSQPGSVAEHWHDDTGSGSEGVAREGSPCLMDRLLGCSQEELMAMLVDKEEEVRRKLLQQRYRRERKHTKKKKRLE